MKRTFSVILSIILVLHILSGCAATGNANGIGAADPDNGAANLNVTNIALNESYPSNTVINSDSKDNISDPPMQPDPAGNESDNTADPKAASDFRTSHTMVAAASGYSTYEFPVKYGENTIYGQLCLPDDESMEYPLVIVSHGFQGSFRLCTAYTDAFASAGFAVYSFDFCGGATFSLSSGSFYDMSVLTELTDLEAIFDSVSSLGFIDRKKIFLMGESQGGMVSALFAAERPDDVAAMVLFYPAFVIPDNAKLLYGTRENIPEWPYAFTMTVGRRYYLDTIDLDIYDKIKAYRGDVLMIHGDQDTVVPYNYSQKALETYEHAELITIFGSNHGFTGQNLVNACQAAVDFLSKYLQ